MLPGSVGSYTYLFSPMKKIAKYPMIAGSKKVKRLNTNATNRTATFTSCDKAVASITKKRKEQGGSHQAGMHERWRSEIGLCSKNWALFIAIERRFGAVA